MEFIPLENEEQLQEISGAKEYNIIFKHNTTCPISKSMRSAFEQEAETIPNVKAVYFLDLLQHRDLSDAIADTFEVPHQSPQLLVVKDGQCICNQALYDISAAEAGTAIAS